MIAHMRTRAERSHRPGRKRTPVGEQIVSRTAVQLLQRILRVTDGGASDWQESNTTVAESLHVDPSTIKRTVRRFCAVGVLRAIETKGGRGHASVYAVDERIANFVLASRLWPTNLPNRRTEEAQEEGQKAAQREEPAQPTPPIHEDVSSDQMPPCGARHDLHPDSDAGLRGHSFLGGLDPSVLAQLAGGGRSAADPLSLACIRQWWEAQPETVRRAIGATAVGAVLVAGAGLLGGWRAAGVAALVSAPAVVVCALSSESDKIAEPSARPEEAAPADRAVDTAHIEPLFQSLAAAASRPML